MEKVETPIHREKYESREKKTELQMISTRLLELPDKTLIRPPGAWPQQRRGPSDPSRVAWRTRGNRTRANRNKHAEGVRARGKRKARRVLSRSDAENEEKTWEDEVEANESRGGDGSDGE